MTNTILDIKDLVVGLGKKPGGSHIIDGMSLEVTRARHCAWSARAARANR